jgi:hypothetical protein
MLLVLQHKALHNLRQPIAQTHQRLYMLHKRRMVVLSAKKRVSV